VSEFKDRGLRVAHRTSDGALVLSLTGELDVASAAVLDACVSELRPMSMPLSIDVSGLVFVDSTGLRSLIAARRAAVDDAGGPVTLIGCTDMLRKLLAITGLSKAFDGVGD
jgi:anti-sigma B factor antagonist